MMEQGVTVCKKCKHFFNLEPTGPRTDVWYNHFCKAKPLPTAVDPYDGKRKAYSTNDLGGKYYVDDAREQYSHCRDINDGACEHYMGNGRVK